jgi:hypothetical protein
LPSLYNDRCSCGRGIGHFVFGRAGKVLTAAFEAQIFVGLLPPAHATPGNGAGIADHVRIVSC